MRDSTWSGLHAHRFQRDDDWDELGEERVLQKKAVGKLRILGANLARA